MITGETMSHKSSFELVMDYYNKAFQHTAENQRSMMSGETASDKPADPTIYDQVVENLNKRIVPEPTRGTLRKALDKADAPLAGRDKADDALKRITR
jgi:hypothetical protein